ncbi:MAG TPA: SdpI family protein [Chitinophagaceae bacterium]|nr:SdpI family protein [Chitinophagaceae bacterium]
MRKHTLLRWTFVCVIALIPWVYLLSIWSSLPERIPVHFRIDGTPDKYGQRNEIFLIPATCTLVSILVYLLLTNIYKIDPKRLAQKQPEIFLKIALVVVVFISCMSIIILNWTATQHTMGMNLVLAMMGLLFAYMGNVMHSIKPNYFAGFRLPWTLESEENWRATHLLGSKIWFAGGILIAILALFIKPLVMFFIMMGIVLVMVIIPTVYSYRMFARSKHNN